MAFLSYNLMAQIPMLPIEQVRKMHFSQRSIQETDLKFDNLIIDAQPMSEDDGISRFEYNFKNVGKDTIHISRMTTSCTCVTAFADHNVILPGDSGCIEVSYNPKGHPGKFERRIYIYTPVNEGPTVTLRLFVDVQVGKDMSGRYPESMGIIRMRTREITFQKGTPAVEKRVFVNVGENDLRLGCETAFLPPCLKFKTVPEVVAPGQEGEIVLTYDPSKSGEREIIPLILNGLGVTPSQSTIIVKMK